MMENSLELKDVGYFCILVYGLSANFDIKGSRVYRRDHHQHASSDLLKISDAITNVYNAYQKLRIETPISKMPIDLSCRIPTDFYGD